MERGVEERERRREAQGRVGERETMGAGESKEEVGGEGSEQGMGSTALKLGSRARSGEPEGVGRAGPEQRAKAVGSLDVAPMGGSF